MLFEDADRERDAAEILANQDASMSSVLDSSDSDQIGVMDDPRTARAKVQGNDMFAGDPSVTLRNARHEQMLSHILAGKPNYVAYQLAMDSRSTRESASQQASRILRRPEVRARLSFLIREARERADGRGGAMNRAEMREILTRAARMALNVSDKVAAVKALQQLEEDGDGPPAPDPAFLAEYLRAAQEQGWTLEQLSAQAPLIGADAGARPTSPDHRADAPPSSVKPCDATVDRTGGSGVTPVMQTDFLQQFE